MKGFSLLELAVGIAVFGIMVVVVGAFARNVFYYDSVASGSLQTSQDARAIIRTMVQELRTTSTGSNGSYPIVAAATSTLTFYSDIDNDGTKEQVHYFITGTALKKGVIEPSGSPLTYNSANETFRTLAQNVKNSTSTNLFDYYASTYSGTSTPMTQPVTVSTIRLVKIILTLDVDQNRAPVPRTYTTQVSLRNLKDNL